MLNPAKMDRLITLRRLKTSTEAAGTPIAITAVATGYPTIFTATGHNRKEAEVVALAGFTGTHATDLNGSNFAVAYVTTNTFAIRENTTGRTITVGTATATPLEWSAQNEYGETVNEWEDYATVWCQKKDVKGLEKWVAQQVKAELDTTFAIHYRDDVSPVNRIVFEGREYDILQVLEIGRRESLDIVAKARAEA